MHDLKQELQHIVDSITKDYLSVSFKPTLLQKMQADLNTRAISRLTELGDDRVIRSRVRMPNNAMFIEITWHDSSDAPLFKMRIQKRKIT